MKPDIASAANLYNYILPVCEAHDKLMIGGDNDIFELAKTLYNAGIYASDIFEGQLSEEESDTGNGKELFFISPYIVLHAIKNNAFMGYEKIDSIARGILNDNSLFDARTYMVNPGFEDHGQSDRIDNRKIFIVYKGSFPDSERAQRREFKKCKEAFSELVLNLTNAIKSEVGHGYIFMDPISNILN
jgi:hypothetical protein